MTDEHPKYCADYMPMTWLYGPDDTLVPVEALMFRTPKDEPDPTEADATIIIVDEHPSEEDRATVPIIRELICHHWAFRHRREVRDQIRAMVARLREIG